MEFALALIFLWIGGTLLYVAFHQLDLESAKGSPADVISSVRTSISQQGSAWSL